MKRIALIMTWAGVLSISGCGASPDGEENGQLQEAVINPFWSNPLFSPYDYMRSDTSIRVCRNASADFLPGQLTSQGCLYAAGNVAKVGINYEYLGTLGGYVWQRALVSNGRGGWSPNPNIPSKMVVSAGVGVCEAKLQASVAWTPGRWTGSGCVVNVGGSVAGMTVGSTSEYVRVLIAP